MSWEVAYDRGVFLDPAWEKPFMCFIISGRVLVLTLTVITSLTLVTLVGAQESGGGVEQKEVQSLIEAVEEVVESGTSIDRTALRVGERLPQNRKRKSK